MVDLLFVLCCSSEDQGVANALVEQRSSSDTTDPAPNSTDPESPGAPTDVVTAADVPGEAASPPMSAEASWFPRPQGAPLKERQPELTISAADLQLNLARGPGGARPAAES